MDNFELYLVDTIKSYADKLRDKRNDKETTLILQNVYDELLSSLAQYVLNCK